jgi:hypothetical protein
MTDRSDEQAIVVPDVPSLSPANLFDLPGFVETKHTRRVADLCSALRQTRTLGLLVGLPGVGKTWAVQYAAQQQHQPELITASLVLYTSLDSENTSRSLMINLLSCLGPDYRAPMADMTRMACCWIHRRQVELIILDEAERLDKASLNVLQEIHDRTRCAFLFVGEPDLNLKFRRYESLLNRLGITMELPLLTFDEMVQFLLQLQSLYLQGKIHQPPPQAEFFIGWEQVPEDLTLLKEIYRLTFGNLRRMEMLIQEAERIAALNGQHFVELPVIRAAAKLLNGRFK